MTFEEWYEKCTKRGTSGDMCLDILQDWRTEREELLRDIGTLLELGEGIIALSRLQYQLLQDCKKD